MLVLSLGFAGSLLDLVFAILAVRIGLRTSIQPPVNRWAWLTTGLIFLLYAVDDLTQLSFGTLAFLQGPEAASYSAYMRWAPIANHSRTFLVWSIYILLTVLAFTRPSRRVLRYGFPGIAAGMLLIGVWLGWSEGSFEAARHLSATSLMDAVGFVALTVMLFLTMVRETVDRALWFSLVCYGFASMVSSLFLAAMAWFNVEDTWTPSPLWMEGIRLGFAVIMVGLGLWRLRRARENRHVPGVLGSMRDRPVLA